MKSKITVIITILLLFALAGCNNTPQTEKMPEPFSFSESNEQTSESDTLPAAEETKEVEPTPEPMQSTESVETESTAESGSTESSKPKEPEQAVAPQKEPSQRVEERNPAPAVTPETEAPPPTPPVQTETAESVPPQETSPQPKSIYDFEFDIDAIRAELIAVGEGMGLTHSGDLTPDNASWATPVTASVDFQGENLKRRLKDYVQSMPELITAYGGNPIQYFTIYAEPLGGGSYRFYFLY